MNLHHEITALHRFAEKSHGCQEAFGPAFPEGVFSLRGQDFDYTIRRLGDGLELEIDTCSAFVAPQLALYDVEPSEDLFEKLLIVFESSQANRSGYDELRRIARAVLSGAAVRLSDGQVRNFMREALACAADHSLRGSQGALA